jgi:hypothetical protein
MHRRYQKANIGARAAASSCPSTRGSAETQVDLRSAGLTPDELERERGRPTLERLWSHCWSQDQRATLCSLAEHSSIPG